MHKKLLIIATLFTFALSLLNSFPALAQPAGDDMTVVGKLNIAEKAVYGSVQSGALLERVGRLEKDVYGREGQDAVLPRIDQVYAYVMTTSEGAPSMLIKLSAVEWMLTHSVTSEPVKGRIENLERLLAGVPSNGPMEERLNKLLKLSYPDGQFEVVSSLIAKDSLVKIKTLSTLNSKQSRVGDSVALGVADDVFIGGVLVIPKGAKGTGKVTKVSPAGNFGRDAKLEVSFDTVDGVDGTVLPTFLGDKAKEETKSMATAAGASVAGMILLGPVGIIGGVFVNGNDANIPIGTQMYVQTKNDTEIYGVRVKQ